MSQSQWCMPSERRRIQALIGECLDLGADPFAWREHMLAGLCRLAGAQLGMAGDAQLVGPQRRFQAGPPVLVGWEDDQRQYYFERTRDQRLADDEILRGFTRPGGRITTRSIEEVIDRPRWHASSQFQDLMRPIGVDCNLVSFFPTSDGRIATLSLFRPLGERWFSRREINLVQALQQELARLVGAVLPPLDAAGRQTLSPRLAQTLRCLLRGMDERQTAAALGIRPTSVHDHVKALYRHFDAASRGELLAIFLRRTGVTAGVRPRQGPPLPSRLGEILQCLLEGDSHKEAAVRLGIAAETVRKYAQELYRRFDVGNRNELQAAFLPR